MHVAIGIAALVIVGGGAILALCYLATHPKNRGPGEGGIGPQHPPSNFNG